MVFTHSLTIAWCQGNLSELLTLKSNKCSDWSTDILGCLEAPQLFNSNFRDVPYHQGFVNDKLTEGLKNNKTCFNNLSFPKVSIDENSRKLLSNGCGAQSECLLDLRVNSVWQVFLTPTQSSSESVKTTSSVQQQPGGSFYEVGDDKLVSPVDVIHDVIIDGFTSLVFWG